MIPDAKKAAGELTQTREQLRTHQKTIDGLNADKNTLNTSLARLQAVEAGSFAYHLIQHCDIP